MYGRPIKARPLMAGQFRLGDISCCKANPDIGGYTCYDSNGTPVWNAAGHAGPIPNPCPENFGAQPPPPPAQPPVGIQPPAPPPTGNDCPPGQFRPAPGQPCRGSVGPMPGGGDLVPTPPGGGGQSAPQPPPTNGGQSAFPVMNCSVPPGYGPQPTGGAAVDRNVWACPTPDGKFNVINARDMSVVQSGISRECLDQYGDVTMQQPDSSACGAPQTGVPTSGPCTLDPNKKYVMCPPSNGITANYFVDAETAGYIQGMTTQPPECANQPNVIKVGANSPYCGGSSVDGAGGGYPQLVACFKSPGRYSHEEGIVDVHNGPDMALLASDIMIKDIGTRFPGKRWIVVTGMFCSALPDFGQAPVAAPAPVAPPTIPTTQTPATQPPPSLISMPGAAPLTYPIQNMWFPESLEPPPIQPVTGGPMAPFQPFPAYQPPPPPPQQPSRPLYAPGQPIPVIDWFGICIDKSRGR